MSVSSFFDTVTQVPFTPEERRRHYISTAASVLTMLTIISPVSWFLVKPVLVSSISSAMAGNVQESIQAEVGPIKGGVEAIINSNIGRLKRQIARLEYRKQASPESWTETDADDLVELQIDLEGQMRALQAIRRKSS